MIDDLDVYQYCETLSRSAQLSDQVIGWTGRWSMLGGFMICARCLATQMVTEANQPFNHTPGCQASTSVYPWHELIAVLNQIPSLPQDHRH